MFDPLSLPIAVLTIIGVLSGVAAFWLWQAIPPAPSLVKSDTVKSDTLQEDVARLPLVQNAIHDMAKLTENLQFRLAEMEIVPDNDETQWRTLFARVNEDVDAIADYTLDLKLLWQLNGANPPLRRERVDLRTLSDEVITHLIPTAKRSGVRLIVQSQAYLPPAYVDRYQMKRVLFNLLDNAIHYSAQQPEPRVVIGLSADQAWMLVEVSDNGAGIPPENLEKFWDESFKPRDARTIDIPGSGLGTVIVRSVVQQHGGRVEVISQTGLTKFTVMLPLVVQPMQSYDQPNSLPRK
jgi:signal transduction histidine kinase